MTAAFTQDNIAGSLFAFWADQLTLEVATVYPATHINTAALDEWFELTIDSWSPRPNRLGGKQFVDVSLSIQCFVKQGDDKSRVHELADAARATISRKTVPIYDFTTSDETLIGYASLFEAEARDLTRNNLNSLQSTLLQIVLTCRGLAFEI